MGYERFYSLLNRLPGRSDDTKDDLIERFTGGRTTSLRQMTEQEYRAMCEALEEETGRPLRKRRSSVLRLMQQIGVDTTNWIRVNAFCLAKRIAGKRCAELDCEELEALAVKLRGIVRKDERKSEVKKTSCHVVLIKPNIRES